MCEDTPVATWCSPAGRVSCVMKYICVAGHVRVGSRDFLTLSVECRFANGASVDACKSVPEAHTLILWLTLSNVRVLYVAWLQLGYDDMFWSSGCENDTQERFLLLPK